MRLFGKRAPFAEYVQDPYPFLNQLRETDPAYYQPERDAWFISDYRLARTVLGDPRFKITSATSFSDQSPIFRSSVVRSLRTFFAPPHPADLISIVDRTVEFYCARLLAGDANDLVSEFSQAIPMRVMCELLGVPESDRLTLRKLAGSVLHTYDLDWSEQERPSAPALDFLSAYFQRHLERARHSVRTGLIDLLFRVQRENRIPEESLIGTCSKLLTAGATTTAACLANGLERLLRNHYSPGPDPHSNTANSFAAAEEFVRLDSPVLGVKRVATDNIELPPISFGRGQKVFLLTSSANRDPLAFPSVRQVQSDRPGNCHLGFGHGRYFCLGAPLARLELARASARLTSVLPKINVQSAPQWRQAWIIREPKTLQVTIK